MTTDLLNEDAVRVRNVNRLDYVDCVFEADTLTENKCVIH
jgi:hypothetical protein